MPNSFTGRSRRGHFLLTSVGRGCPMRLEVHVHPGSRKALVGGSHDGALVVRVQARAVDGAATDEVLDVVAEAFHVRRGAVQLVRGPTRDARC